MSRTRRTYADILGGSITSDGQAWQSSIAPNMTSGYATLPYSITIGAGKTAQSFSEITIWQDGVISLGLPTKAQTAFMSHFEGSQNIDLFPGYYISAGYTDESGVPVSDGNYDTGYGVEIATGDIDFTVPFDSPGTVANETPVIRITWGDVGGTPGEIDTDKQVLLLPTSFMIGPGNDDKGAGYGFDLLSVNGADVQIPGTINYLGDDFAKVRSDFYGDAQSSVLMQNSTGGVDIGEIGSGGQFSYNRVDNDLATTRIVGSGDYLGEGHAQFLMETTSGAVSIAEVAAIGQTATFTPFASLGAWQVVGTGDYLGEGRDQFLIENASGALYIAQEGPTGQAIYHSFSALAAGWTVIATGDYLGRGHDQFLAENASGAVNIGQLGSGVEAAPLTHLTTLSGWTLVGSGDYIGEGRDQFMIESAAGALYLGEDGPDGQLTYHSFGSLAAGWKVVASGDYFEEGHDQFLIESAAGQLMIGDDTGGAVHFTTQTNEISTLWTFHG
jgi:hypothetical protein